MGIETGSVDALSVSVIPDHDCAYRDHADRLRLQGAHPLRHVAVLNPRVEADIAQLHGDNGVCPPTHPGGNMTMPGSEWSNFSKTYRTPRDVL